MKVKDLEDSSVMRARWGRAGKTGPIFCMWQYVELRVQRNGKGKVVLVGLKGGRNWVEYDPRRHLDRSGILVHEDFYLEIEGLTGTRTAKKK